MSGVVPRLLSESQAGTTIIRADFCKSAPLTSSIRMPSTQQTTQTPQARLMAHILGASEYLSGPQLVAGAEHPRDHQGTHQQNEHNGQQADVMVHIGHAVKTPAKAADQIHHRVK